MGRFFWSIWAWRYARAASGSSSLALVVPVVLLSVEVEVEVLPPPEVVVDGLDVAALTFPVKAFLLPLPFAGGTVPVPAPGLTADLEESTLFLGISIEAFPFPSADPA
jgi:hypothetical protein